MTQQSATPAVEAGFVRSSFAVHADVHEGLPALVKALGLRSTAQLLTLLVRERETVLPALKPIAEGFLKKSTVSATSEKAQRRELKKRVDELPPEKLAELMRLVEQGGSAGAEGSQP
jgi:hypothetical protein